MEEDEANEFEQMHEENAFLGREGEKKEKGRRSRTGVKKEEKGWREGVRSKSLSLFMYLGVGSDGPGLCSQHPGTRLFPWLWNLSLKACASTE